MEKKRKQTDEEREDSASQRQSARSEASLAMARVLGVDPASAIQRVMSPSATMAAFLAAASHWENFS